MIKLTRIDDRLLHGQVALTWIPTLKVDCIIVANDDVAKDEFQKMALGIAKPAGAKLLIKSIADTITFLNDDRSKNISILILVNCVKDAAELANGVTEITAINFGGIRGKEGSRLISKAIALAEDDIIIIKQLLEKNIELEIRQVPADKKQLVQELI